MSKEWKESKGAASNSNSNSVEEESGDGPDNFPLGLIEDESSSSNEEEEYGFYVQVETIMGNKFQIFAYPSDSVDLLKTRIAYQEGIPQKEQHLSLSKGRIPLDNPNALLSDLDINESNSLSRPIQLVTSVSSGIGSKAFVNRDSSPPTSFPSLPFIPHPLCSLRRTRKDSASAVNVSQRDGREEGEGRQSRNAQEPPLRLPRLDLEEENVDVDGVIFLKDREERKVFLIVRKKAGAGEERGSGTTSVIRGRRSMGTMTGIGDGSGDVGGRQGLLSGRRDLSNASLGTLERIRENAKTLQKMHQIRENLLAKRKGQNSDRDQQPGPSREMTRNENTNRIPSLPSIFERHSRESPPNPPSQRRPASRERFGRRQTSSALNRSIMATFDHLSRLKAEIYLEAKKAGCGGGLLPYTEAQLWKYVQLKVKLLLADNYPQDYESVSSRFSRRADSEERTLPPTVCLKRQQHLAELQMENVSIEKYEEISNQRMANGFPVLTARNRDSSTSTCASDVGVLKDINNSRIGSKVPSVKVISRMSTARRMVSEESVKSDRAKKQKSNIFLKSGGVSVRSLRSGGRRPPNSEQQQPGTSSTIQKKKKDVVRCAECRKKIGVACRYQCRCGKTFCSTHRYAEAHTCTYDYKTAGRKELEQANPLIVASKLEKI